jgi:inner membrane protein
MTIPDPARRLLARLPSSHLFRLLSLGVLVLLLLIPVERISGVMEERAERRSQAVAEVTGKWGGEQTLIGPVLMLPYWVRPPGATQSSMSWEKGLAYFLPETLHANGQLEAEERSRGIFAVPVYSAKLELRGSFAPPDIAALGIAPEEVDWAHAQVVLGISDVSAIQATPALRWQGTEHPFLPGSGAAKLAETGIHVDVPLAHESRETIEFSFPLALRGSEGIWLYPFARDTEVSLASRWPSPSFQGSWLPGRRQVSDGGFDATWDIPYLARSFDQSWTEVPSKALAASRFGVRLVSPVDANRMAQRSVKYAGLFIVLTFAAIWLVEVLAELRVHPIQYLLIGAALCLFFLLELALGEHLPFSAAYALASGAVLVAVTGYARAVLGSLTRAGAVAGVIAALYGYLYTLLLAEDDALLFGSLGLFAALSALMWLTRRVDWSRAVSSRLESPAA